jgi:hypothetical protein
MRIEHPNYYGIAVIFNYHSSGSSMYKYLTFITEFKFRYLHKLWSGSLILNYENEILFIFYVGVVPFDKSENCQNGLIKCSIDFLYLN